MIERMKVNFENPAMSLDAHSTSPRSTSALRLLAAFLFRYLVELALPFRRAPRIFISCSAASKSLDDCRR